MRPKISSSTTMSIHQARNGGPTRTSGLVPSSRASVSNFRVPALVFAINLQMHENPGQIKKKFNDPKIQPTGLHGPKSCDHQDVGNPVWGSAILNASLSSIYNEGKETFMEVVRNKNNSWLSQSSKGPGSANKLIADRLEELKQEAPVPDEEDF